ncbi:MAG: acyl-ACP thioesterase domain-containing protein [Solirubrobacteraceae bacterium]
MTDAFGEPPARPAGARAFSQPRTPGFADCAPSGRVRLDAMACWLQDVAYADVQDAGLAQSAVWVVRRTRIRVNRFPRFGERFRLTTFCSGLGRMWAERGTDITRDGEALPDVQASSLWVHLDVERWVPTPLTEAEMAAYAGTVPAPRVSARLRHPAPDPAVTDGRPWTFRATECDLADHVNNAAYWAPLEEELLSGAASGSAPSPEPPPSPSPSPEPARIDVELEYRAPAQPGEKRMLADGNRRWIVADDGELHASFLLAPIDF